MSLNEFIDTINTTDVSTMHNNRIILFFIETGKLWCSILQ